MLYEEVSRFNAGADAEQEEWQTKIRRNGTRRRGTKIL